MPWIVSLGYDYLVDGKGAQAGLGSASLLLYFGVTYTIQRLILQARARRIADVSPRTREPAIKRERWVTSPRVPPKARGLGCLYGGSCISI